MKKRFLCLIGVLTLFALSIASAKTYEIVLSSPAKVGNTQLAAGRYDLKVKGPEATFINVADGKSVKLTAKVETSDRKFDQTEVKMIKDANGERVESIRLEGSKSELRFN